MNSKLARLLAPRSIAVIGGGAWCRSVVQTADKMGFEGDIYPVHPRDRTIAGRPALPSISHLPANIDAAFIGINREATVAAIGELAARNTGGAVCFASGFKEVEQRGCDQRSLQTELVSNAGEMPILGPNCYGFVNALDRVAIWPDQHGMQPVNRGVAILTQSSNIAINLTMQKRGLPIGYMVTCGNMAQTSQAEIALSLLEDDRVTAIGLHVEGFGNTSEWHDLAQRAWSAKKPLVVLKVGRSDLARQAAVTHTASLSGSDAGAQALLDRLGIPRVHDLATFLETLKIFHSVGKIHPPTLSSISCSGGEASLVADLAATAGIDVPTLTTSQIHTLTSALGPKVPLSNPLDYHTYIWRDPDAMSAAWAPMAADHIGITMAVVDYPHTDAADWACATETAIRVRQVTGRPFAVAASLPELMPADVAGRLSSAGVVPLNGLQEAMGAIKAATIVNKPNETAPIPPGNDRDAVTWSEIDSKALLAQYGIPVPKFETMDRSALKAPSLPPPFAVKSVGLAHKSDQGGVTLGINTETLETVVAVMPGETFLIEQMVQGCLFELLIGVTRDPAHGFVLTLGAGGTRTELLGDVQSLLVPTSREDAKQALFRLKHAPLLRGYRGKPACAVNKILDVIDTVQTLVADQQDQLEELEINPLMATETEAIAADALIRMADKGG